MFPILLCARKWQAISHLLSVKLRIQSYGFCLKLCQVGGRFAEIRFGVLLPLGREFIPREILPVLA
jgi:hypothetical protein